MSPVELTAIELREKIGAGEITSVEAVRAAFEQIERVEPTVGAFISTFRDAALARAADVDRRIRAGEAVGPLAGVPVAVKDVMCTRFGATS